MCPAMFSEFFNCSSFVKLWICEIVSSFLFPKTITPFQLFSGCRDDVGLAVSGVRGLYLLLTAYLALWIESVGPSGAVPIAITSTVLFIHSFVSSRFCHTLNSVHGGFGGDNRYPRWAAGSRGRLKGELEGRAGCDNNDRFKERGFGRRGGEGLKCWFWRDVRRGKMSLSKKNMLLNSRRNSTVDSITK